MKKNCFLGVDHLGQCCLLYTLADFNMLSEHVNEIAASDFVNTSTNWYGRDDIDRTCKIEKLELTGRVLQLNKVITYYGSDYDCGHNYPWEFSFYKIVEVRHKEE